MYQLYNILFLVLITFISNAQHTAKIKNQKIKILNKLENVEGKGCSSFKICNLQWKALIEFFPRLNFQFRFQEIKYAFKPNAHFQTMNAADYFKLNSANNT